MNSNDYELLGKAVKKTQAQYRDYSDEEVGRIISKKYPQYAKTILLDPKHFKAAAEVQEVIAKQQELEGNIHGLKAARQDREYEREQKQANVEASLASTKMNVTAANAGMDLLTFSQVNATKSVHVLELEKMTVASQLEVDKMQIAAKLEVDTELTKLKHSTAFELQKEREQADIAVERETRMRAIELEFEQRKLAMKVEAAMRVRFATHHHILFLQEQLLKQVQVMRQLSGPELDIAMGVYEGLKGELDVLTGQAGVSSDSGETSGGLGGLSDD